ncbi:MAG: DUF5597 domain-containing protein [Bacteroidales bacterium]|nr:DUF5597 domain-containing protein [Bacteroidales bacterium]
MKRVVIISIVCILSILAHAQVRLEHRGGSTARIVANGKPMLMIGGELGNSSASNLGDVRRNFRHLHQLGLNTVLAPITWELIEPEEGKFDMTSLDNIIDEARSNDLKVVLLWFGAWKNSMSCYAPEWFKRDTQRFPRAHTRDGKPVEEASSLSANVLDADRRAFVRIMEHLRKRDSKEQTVIMIQVENEIGMIDVPRDYSEDATKLYQSAIPQQLTDYLKKNQESLHPYIKEKIKSQVQSNMTWTELFGEDIYTEEIFQTWTYATYVEQIAKAGREVYDLPMYVNVALNSRGREPGQYPSGGPLAHLIDLWHCGAPSIDVLGVDIYDKGIKSWFDKYHLPNNPLFVPEIRLEDKDAMYALYAFGHHGAMGFCPFSIEDYPLYATAKGNDMRDMDLSQDDQLNAFSNMKEQKSLSPLASVYRLLREVESSIIASQGTPDMDAVLLDNEQREAEIITPDGIRLTIKHSYSLGWEPGAKDEIWPEVACIILRLGKEDYLAIGSGVVITYSPAETSAIWQPGDARIGLAKCEALLLDTNSKKITGEGKKGDGFDLKDKTLRRLSGDQTHQGRHVRIPVGEFEIQHFRLYRYK